MKKLMWIKKMLKRMTTPEQRMALRRVQFRMTYIFSPRYLTAPFRVLPNFLVLGVQKGGTTSLFHYLVQHPDIISPTKKELHVFDHLRTAGCGEMFYRSHFPTIFQKYFRKGKTFLTGEATPDYLFFPYVPSRLAPILPHFKGIILLRNPIDRAYSQYVMNVKKKIDLRSFEEAIAEERKNLTTKSTNDECWEEAIAYLARGIYVQQLERWFRNFPKENFLIIQSEKFFEDPNAILQQVLTFLGLSSFEFKNLKKYNEGNYAQTLSLETKELLQQFFKPYNQKLYEYLGVDYGW